MKKNDEKINMKTMSSCINSLQEKDFTVNFMVRDNRLVTPDSEVTYSPDEIKVLNFYRFEGESDPDDSAILYAIETNDGTRGILSDAYGIYADDGVQQFMSAVEDISKKSIET